MLQGVSITRKLQVVITLTTALALGLACAAFIVYELQRFKKAERESLRTLAQVVADAGSAPLAYSNRTEAARTLQMLGAESSVRAAALYDTNGVVFAQLHARNDRSVPGKPDADGLYEKSGFLVIFQPVSERGQRDGTLFIRWDLGPMYDAMRFYVGIALLVLVGSLVAAYLIGGRLQKSIAQPVLTLAETARAVADCKDYSVRAQKQSDDEIGVLTVAFNQMLSEIQASQARLAAELAERRRAEEALRDSEAVLRTVTNEAQVGLVMVNKDHRYRFANQTYAEILGLSETNILGRRIADMLPGIYENQIRPRLDIAFTGQRVSYELHLAEHPRTKDERFYEVVYEPRISGTEEPYVVVVIVDVTERKKAQQLLERTVDERTAALRETIGYLETFSYSITHDMRGPLRAMRSFAQLLANEAGPQLNAEHRDYLRRITDAARRLDQLIQDVLTYSRVTKSEMPLERVDLGRLLADIIEQYADLAASREHIIVEASCHGAQVLGNTAGMTQVISNLLTNAVKFVPPGRTPEVRVRCEDRADRVRVIVSDNGIGIPKEHQEKIFGLFQRLHTAEQYPGTGVGLPIVKKAVERMGGAMGMESEPGRGSTFWVEFVKAGAETPAPAARFTAFERWGSNV